MFKEEETQYCPMCEEWAKKYEQFKAENEELKDLNTRLDNQRETYWKEYQKLKQALLEIKEIADYEFNERMDAEDYHNMTEVLQQILQKCEVIKD